MLLPKKFNGSTELNESSKPNELSEPNESSEPDELSQLSESLGANGVGPSSILWKVKKEISWIRYTTAPTEMIQSSEH